MATKLFCQQPSIAFSGVASMLHCARLSACCVALVFSGVSVVGADGSPAQPLRPRQPAAHAGPARDGGQHPPRRIRRWRRSAQSRRQCGGRSGRGGIRARRRLSAGGQPRRRRIHARSHEDGRGPLHRLPRAGPRRGQRKDVSRREGQSSYRERQPPATRPLAFPARSRGWSTRRRHTAGSRWHR